jgi:hypothetical protein
MKSEAKGKVNMSYWKEKISGRLPLILTLLIHGSLILFLILEPFSRITEDSMNYVTLTTDMMEFIASGGTEAPSFPTVQYKKPDISRSSSVTSTMESGGEAAVNLNDTTGTKKSSENATPDTLTSNSIFSDTLNYMDFYSGSGGGGSGGSGIMAGNMKLPTFMGGDFNVFRNWFLKRFRIPLDAPENYKERIVVAFSVDKEGTMRNIKVRYCSSREVENEIIRVLKTAPKWEPGQYNGATAGFNLQMPVNFKGY